jgi:4-carboxymuconolactone decarboxylase
MTGSQPRVKPLAPDELDERQAKLLADIDGGGLNIFATLARHPRLMERWLPFGGVLLYRGELPPRERELLILRTSVRCRADYEWGQHVRIGRDAGLTDREIAQVVEGPAAEGWSPFDAVLVQAADELHDDARISDATWEALAARYDARQLIELCMLVGNYHLVAFALNSLGIEREDGVEALPE